MELKIQEVINEVHNRSCVGPNGMQPMLCIYMDYEYWSDCMREIKGGVSHAIHEFHNRNVILGYPVYRVVSYNEVNHVPFRVVQI